MPKPLPTLQEMARLLGGEVRNGSIACPGPGHDPADRSLSVKPDANDPEGFVVHPFSPRDDWRECRALVRSKLCLPKWEPKTKKKGNGNGAKPYSPTIAKFVYRQADGQPYLCVHRTADKKFPQFHWDGEMWKPSASLSVTNSVSFSLESDLISTIISVLFPLATSSFQSPKFSS